jgi:hypothetical protein
MVPWDRWPEPPRCGPSLRAASGIVPAGCEASSPAGPHVTVLLKERVRGRLLARE